MFAFLSGLASAGLLVSLWFLIIRVRRKDWNEAGYFLVLFIAAGISQTGFGDADARGKGFHDLSEMREAEGAGYRSGVDWSKNRDRVRAEKAAKAAEVRAYREAVAAQEKATDDATEALAQVAFSGEALVRAKLKDAGSATIRTVMIQKNARGGLVVCGLVNAKNSFGAYTGEKGFMATPQTGNVEIETGFSEDDVSFRAGWSAICG